MSRLPGYRPYHETLIIALHWLCSAADSWARDGIESLSADDVLAAIVQMLRTSAHVLPTLPLSLNQYLRHVAPFEELLVRRTCPDQKLELQRMALLKLRQLMTMAAHDWSVGDSENPSAFSVLYELATVLFNHRLVELPPPPNLDG